MALHVNQQRAIVLLSLGKDINSIARELDISRQTLCRWKKIPAFDQALSKTVGENMAGMRTQVQLTAQTFIEGGLDSAQQLRHMILKVNTTDMERRLSCTAILRHTQRFWDLMGFNAKLPNPTSLLNDKLPELQEAEAIEKVSFHPKDREPGDRAERPGTEEDRAMPGACAGFQPDYVHAWANNPVNDDGTPKRVTDPQPVDEVQPKPFDPTRTVKEQVEAATEELIKQHEAPITIHPASYKPKPKAWKRSHTTTRCKPAKTSSPAYLNSTSSPTSTSMSRPSARANSAPSQISNSNATPSAAAHGPG